MCVCVCECVRVSNLYNLTGRSEWTVYTHVIYPVTMQSEVHLPPACKDASYHRHHNLLRRRLVGFYSRPPTSALRSMKFLS